MHFPPETHGEVQKSGLLLGRENRTWVNNKLYLLQRDEADKKSICAAGVVKKLISLKVFSHTHTHVHTQTLLHTAYACCVYSQKVMFHIS